MTFIKTEDLPCTCKTCDDIKERAHYFIEVQYIGKMYYVPVTPPVAKLFGFPTNHGPDWTPTNVPFERAQSIERILRDLIASIYLQIRDTVGDEIKTELSRQVSEGFAELIEKGLSLKVDEKLNGKLLKKSP